jgi:hypothetical protein
MLYILSWVMILICIPITTLAVGVFLVNRNLHTKFATWWKENIIDRDPEDKFFE